MPTAIYRPDAYGHTQPVPAGAALAVALAAGAVSTTAVGTIAPTTAAGATPTVTFAAGQTAYDECGTFTLSPVTGGGAQAAGSVAVVTFSQAMEAAPKGISVSMCDNAAGAGQVAVLAAAQNITTAGFTINVASALTTAHTYTVSYSVKP